MKISRKQLRKIILEVIQEQEAEPTQAQKDLDANNRERAAILARRAEEEQEEANAAKERAAAAANAVT